MESIFCKDLYESVGAVTDHQKLGMSALVMAVITEPMNHTGFSWDKREDVEKVIYGDSNLITRIATLAGIGAGNELLDEVNAEFPNTNISYKAVFEFLEGKTIIPGVSYE